MTIPGDNCAQSLTAAYPSTALHGAVDAGDVSVLRALLQGGVDPNTPDRKGLTALHHAVQVGSKPIIAELVANGASLTCRDKDGKQPIDYASHNPELEMILQLLNTNAPAAQHLSLDAPPQ